MKDYKEDEFLSLSGIQHFAFCRRQWALIHIEQQWAENLRTVEGNLLHEKAHDRFSSEKRGDIIISRGMAIHSSTLGVNGECDVVEFHRSESGVALQGREGVYKVYPIEYKRGEPKESDVDVLQLMAQAMCLEEMLCCDIDKGYLFYGEIKRRVAVEFDEGLRTRVRELFEEMHKMYERRYTPKVKRSKSCNACSLKDLCLPILCKNKSAKSYMEQLIGGEGG